MFCIEHKIFDIDYETPERRESSSDQLCCKIEDDVGATILYSVDFRLIIIRLDVLVQIRTQGFGLVWILFLYRVQNLRFASNELNLKLLVCKFCTRYQSVTRDLSMILCLLPEYSSALAS